MRIRLVLTLDVAVGLAMLVFLVPIAGAENVMRARLAEADGDRIQPFARHSLEIEFGSVRPTAGATQGGLAMGGAYFYGVLPRFEVGFGIDSLRFKFARGSEEYDQDALTYAMMIRVSVPVDRMVNVELLAGGGGARAGGEYRAPFVPGGSSPLPSENSPMLLGGGGLDVKLTEALRIAGLAKLRYFNPGYLHSSGMPLLELTAALKYRFGVH